MYRYIRLSSSQSLLEFPARERAGAKLHARPGSASIGGSKSLSCARSRYSSAEGERELVKEIGALSPSLGYACTLYILQDRERESTRGKGARAAMTDRANYYVSNAEVMDSALLARG